MKLYNVRGKLVGKEVSRYRIKWEKPSRSKAQFKVKSFLRKYWQNHICYEEFPVYGTLLKVDLMNMTKRIAVEVQGKQHENFNKFFHDNSRLNFLKSIRRDNAKLEWLTLNKFTLIEIYENEVDSLSLDFFQEKFGLYLV